VVDAGLISGSTYAVKFAAGFTNQLVIDPGATLSGTVTGGNALGGGAVSTLELSSGTASGTISGLGSHEAMTRAHYRPETDELQVVESQPFPGATQNDGRPVENGLACSARDYRADPRDRVAVDQQGQQQIGRLPVPEPDRQEQAHDYAPLLPSDG
jgi:hypothetical protein